MDFLRLSVLAMTALLLSFPAFASDVCVSLLETAKLKADRRLVTDRRHWDLRSYCGSESTSGSQSLSLDFPIGDVPIGIGYGANSGRQKAWCNNMERNRFARNLFEDRGEYYPPEIFPLLHRCLEIGEAKNEIACEVDYDAKEKRGFLYVFWKFTILQDPPAIEYIDHESIDTSLRWENSDRRSLHNLKLSRSVTTFSFRKLDGSRSDEIRFTVKGVAGECLALVPRDADDREQVYGQVTVEYPRNQVIDILKKRVDMLPNNDGRVMCIPADLPKTSPPLRFETLNNLWIEEAAITGKATIITNVPKQIPANLPKVTKRDGERSVDVDRIKIRNVVAKANINKNNWCVSLRKVRTNVGAELVVDMKLGVNDTVRMNIMVPPTGRKSSNVIDAYSIWNNWPPNPEFAQPTQPESLKIVGWNLKAGPASSATTVTNRAPRNGSISSGVHAGQLLVRFQ